MQITKPCALNETGRRENNEDSIYSEKVKAGEEAATHPRRNVITRVMQPNQEELVHADIHESDDIEPGDYFFLCTDGVIESVSDELLCDIIGRDIDDETKMKAIHEACLEGSRDNFSAYLISVAGVN